MDLFLPISDDRTALARIVAGLFAMLGLTGGRDKNSTPQRIARALHGAVVVLLRPAESAVRRLIYVLSLSVKAQPAAGWPMPAGIAGAGAAQTRAAFKLFDPRPRLVRKARKVRASVRISFFGEGGAHVVDLREKPGNADGLIASTHILRRLEALKHALDDLPRQARRLARVLQRRKTWKRLGSRRPMRPGYPPGHRGRGRREIDDILRRCHWRACQALPDTS